VLFSGVIISGLHVLLAVAESIVSRPRTRERGVICALDFSKARATGAD
jgi:hypothetical protein